MTAISTRQRELVDAEYTKFRKELLKKKGSDRQRQFLKNVIIDKDFLDEFTNFGITGSTEIKVISTALTESEFRDPPPCTEKALYDSWPELTPSIACRTTFWSYVTISHIKAGKIRSKYLASPSGNVSSGGERIDLALDEQRFVQPKLMDDCVRAVLRRLGGLPEVRGNRSVFVDCPFARAWWRERMIRQAAKDKKDMEEKIRTILRTNQTYWEKLIDRIVFRNSTFGSDNIRGAFLRALADFVQEDQSTDLRSPSGLQRLCRRATAYQGAKELSFLDDNELNDLMEEIVWEA